MVEVEKQSPSSSHEAKKRGYVFTESGRGYTYIHGQVHERIF